MGEHNFNSECLGAVVRDTSQDVHLELVEITGVSYDDITLRFNVVDPDEPRVLTKEQEGALFVVTPNYVQIFKANIFFENTLFRFRPANFKGVLGGKFKFTPYNARATNYFVGHPLYLNQTILKKGVVYKDWKGSSWVVSDALCSRLGFGIVRLKRQRRTYFPFRSYLLLSYEELLSSFRIPKRSSEKFDYR